MVRYIRSHVRYVLVLAVLLATSAGLAADEPRRIPFQARLTDAQGAPIPDDVYDVIFSIYSTASGGTPLWTERHENLSVVLSQVNVILGAIVPFDNPGQGKAGVSFSATDGRRYLGVTVGKRGQPAQEMVPRHELVPAFQAVRADIASAVVPGAITDSMVKDGAITNVKLRDGAVSNSKIAADAITSDKVADGSLRGADLSTAPADRIGNAQIADGAISRRNLASDVTIATVPSGTIIAWAGEETSIPEGWYHCDGRVLDKDTDPELFKVLGTQYGFQPGNPKSFRLPDYRGYFLRGWDKGRGADPDASKRADRGDGQTGDKVGTKQSYAVEEHKHTAPDGGQFHVWYTPGGGLDSTSGRGVTHITSSLTGPQPNPGTETRPRNISVLYLIKR